MPTAPTERNFFRRSPIGPVLGKSQGPTKTSQKALLKAMEGLPPPVHSPTNPSTSSSNPFSLDSISGTSSTSDSRRDSHMPMEAGLPVKGKRLGVGVETSSMRLVRELQVALEEAEKAGIQNKFDEGESLAPNISSRTKRRNQRAMMAGKVAKATRGQSQGNRVLRGNGGVTKNKKAALGLERFGLGSEREESGSDNVGMPNGTISPAGRSTDIGIKDPSPSSGDVSMHDAGGNSPEVTVGGNKVETPESSSAVGMARRIGRHIGIFVAAVQDSTNDLRDNEEYEAWRSFLGKL
ncbi:hypothetical protein C7212DRAFT_364758 [Tuber magnatum]|uniref:Uncharacterized protein n=1 Tax=Tuber magnatum TaxID=42249 RepID=A0A317SKQ6_9PEZI|nr:hypothetical protein C7212DRAFT_364758 [Tuber magnatum]